MSHKILFPIFFASLLAGRTIAATTDITGPVSEIEVHSTDPTDQASCEVGKAFVKISSTYYYFPSTGDEGRALLAVFQTARTLGANVFIRVTDQKNICPGNYKRVTIAKNL